MFQKPAPLTAAQFAKLHEINKRTLHDYDSSQSMDFEYILMLKQLHIKRNGQLPHRRNIVRKYPLKFKTSRSLHCSAAAKIICSSYGRHGNHPHSAIRRAYETPVIQVNTYSNSIVEGGFGDMSKHTLLTFSTSAKILSVITCSTSQSTRSILAVIAVNRIDGPDNHHIFKHSGIMLHPYRLEVRPLQ